MVRSDAKFHLLLLGFALPAIMLVAINLFWVAAFFANGLHQFPPTAISAQQTAGAGDFPFRNGAAPHPLLGGLLTVAALGSAFGPFALPVALIWLGLTLSFLWDSISKIERSVYLAAILVALGITLLMWSPLGWTVRTWVLD